MTEGELKKLGELEKLIQSLMQTPDYKNWGWGADAILLIMNKIDEAKKDFPYFIPKWVDHGEVKYGRKKFYKNDVKKWFKKWFGDSS